MRSWALPALSTVALASLAFACALQDSKGAFAEGTGGGSGGADAGGAFGGEANSGVGKSPDLVPTDNGIIMVHAAGMPAFRLCFESEPDRLPAPDREVMPDANVVGVEVGSAVRIEPLKGPPGKIWIFDESLIRDFSGKGATCRNLLNNSQFLASARAMPPITTDYSKGVHLLVVRGCQGNTAFSTYSKAECGDTWDPAKGNLSLFDTELTGAIRNGDELPTEVIHLSQAVEGTRADAGLAVTFGQVGDGGAPHSSIAAGPTLFGPPLKLTEPPTFDPTNQAIYEQVGFRVRVGNAVVAQQSLADVQKLSAPREIPTTYYATASNYVLLLLGHPSPKLSDGGADTDPLRKVHLLAVPVIEPKADAGAEGGATDGGTPDGAL